MTSGLLYPPPAPTFPVTSPLLPHACAVRRSCPPPPPPFHPHPRRGGCGAAGGCGAGGCVGGWGGCVDSREERFWGAAGGGLGCEGRCCCVLGGGGLLGCCKGIAWRCGTPPGARARVGRGGGAASGARRRGASWVRRALRGAVGGGGLGGGVGVVVQGRG